MSGQKGRRWTMLPETDMIADRLRQMSGIMEVTGGDNRFDIGAYMELTGADELNSRDLNAELIYCSYPDCDKTCIGIPLLDVPGVRCGKPGSEYLCPDHNNCFYCKVKDPTFYRICVSCLEQREQRHKFRALPPPLKADLSDPIGLKTGFPRDVINLICKKMHRVDQMAWAIACGANWKRRPCLVKQARRHGTPRQVLWFLKQGCLPIRHVKSIIDYLMREFGLSEAVQHVRRYHAAMMRKYKRNVLEDYDMCGEVVVYMDIWEFAKDQLTQIKLSESAESVFRWAFQLRSRKTVGGYGGDYRYGFTVDHLIRTDRIDLLEWLKENGCEDMFATRDRIREADARRSWRLLELFNKENPELVVKCLKNPIVVNFRSGKWDYFRSLAEIGCTSFTQHLTDVIEDRRWTWIEREFGEMAWDDVVDGTPLRPFIELLAEFNISIPESWIRAIVLNKCSYLLQKLVDMKFKMHQCAMKMVFYHGLSDCIPPLLQSGLQPTPDDIVSSIVRKHLDSVKVLHQNGWKFQRSDWALAEIFGYEPVTEFIEKAITDDKLLSKDPL